MCMTLYACCIHEKIPKGKAQLSQAVRRPKQGNLFLHQYGRASQETRNRPVRFAFKRIEAQSAVCCSIVRWECFCNSNSCDGNADMLLQEECYFRAYIQYFARFIEANRGHGI